jgi:cytosine/adenosine deaminase-related metal-dependent hydrolase
LRISDWKRDLAIRNGKIWFRPLKSEKATYMLKCVHRAKYVLAEPDLLLSNAAVHISGQGRISAVEPWHDPPAIAEVEVIDWGSAVIIPGLINAHTHLELTSLHGRLTGFRSFTDWVSQLIGRRRLWTREDFLDSAREGAKAALSSGTTLAGDISSSGLGWHATRGEDLRRVVFEEVIGLSPGNLDSALSQLESLLESAQQRRVLPQKPRFLWT